MDAQERHDSPNTFHHVGTRALGRRSLFENTTDYRFFLSLVAKAVRQHLFEVHSYCLMTNHVHLLVRTTCHRLAVPMRWILGQYARVFNRLRGRDGPLLKSRFFSRPIDDDEDLERVVRYIDHNPVAAGFAQSILEHPFGSARHYARLSGPRWLSRTEVEQLVANPSAYRPEHYFAALESELTPADEWVVEERLWRRHAHRLPAHLEATGSTHWMELAMRADGHSPGYVIVAPPIVLAQIDSMRSRHGSWSVGQRCGWMVLTCGVLRELSCRRLADIAHTIGRSTSCVARVLTTHGQIKRSNERYRNRYREALKAMLNGAS